MTKTVPPAEPEDDPFDAPAKGSGLVVAPGVGFLEPQEADPVLRGVQAAEAKRKKETRQGLTGELLMPEFRSLVQEVVGEFPRTDWLPMLRKAASEKELRLRDPEILRLAYQARQAQRGRLGPILPDQPLDLSPTAWCWEGIVLSGCVNLWVAAPKVGKSSLWAACIAAWASGAPEFLGRPLVGPCPPVALMWMDQPERDSARMLRAAGLLRPDGCLLDPPITQLRTAGRPLHLDPEGVEEIAVWGETHPGGLLVLDSYAAAVRPLGLEEASAEFAGPLQEVLEAVEPFAITTLVVHHSSKGRSGEGPAMASRGSTALPAAASQIVAIARVSPQNPADRRLLLQAQGRGGPEVHMLIERKGDVWACHGSGDEVIAAQRRDQARERLTERQQAALDLVARRWRDGAGETTAADLVGEAAGCDLEGKSAPRLARKVLTALGRLELVHLRRVGNGVSARPWGEPEGPPGPLRPPGPIGPTGPQISQVDGSGDLEDPEDHSDEGDQGDPCDRFQAETDQLLLEGMA